MNLLRKSDRSPRKRLGRLLLFFFPCTQQSVIRSFPTERAKFPHAYMGMPEIHILPHEARRTRGDLSQMARLRVSPISRIKPDQRLKQQHFFFAH